MTIFRSTRIAAVALAAWLACPPLAPAAEVKLDGTGGNYKLLVDGQPFFIEGAGGDGPKQFLKDCGGNSFRTWGIGDDTGAKLDEAEKLGLKVTLGIWLGHERHKFSYTNMKMVSEQFDKAKAAVEKYKDHPALLMWAVGNEMEGYGDGDNPAIWAAVNNIAAMIKQVDGKHPTMTVTAEIGGGRVEAMHKLCPAIDVVGLNTYGGGPSIGKRYRAAGGTKPFVLTEYGPPGTWEVGKNSWNVPQELTSTAKAKLYRATYEETILAEKDKLCLGGYAFTWGNKQEATATWFGLFLGTGERLEPVDTLTELWSGKKPENRCPQIEPLKVVGADRAKPGDTIKAQLAVVDPEGDPLKIEWRLEKDMSMYQEGGDFQPDAPRFPDAILKQGEKDVEVKMPGDAGGYFLYALVKDGNNGAAVANVPLFVDGGTQSKLVAKKGQVPMTVYADGMGAPKFVWSGWMGKHEAIAMDEKSTDNPHAGATCMKAQFKSPDNFGGIIWQSPANDWGDNPGGFNLTGATKLSFWARGETGGEKVDFVMGVIKADKPYHDSASAELRGVALTNEWKQYEIDLNGKDLSSIKTGFGWVVPGQGKPVTFYLDDIKYE
ncbi:MAG TPA: glycoside hydrolase family 2 TIM barrel-domain containing protein [Tepidisphaeraceae bacterium]|jgi:hypothetical protein